MPKVISKRAKKGWYRAIYWRLLELSDKRLRMLLDILLLNGVWKSI